MYPCDHRPWHVFVDASPDNDADFEVAATFDVKPTQEDVNYDIVKCLEGSEKEDEIVVQQCKLRLRHDSSIVHQTCWGFHLPTLC
mmetsp:Transcript_24195/g.43374  ORF Transcript_24195/g.43374 Transcript_24195/m.43374 type:complete len:85 (-) Transcript_24195:265-519(-)